MIRAGWLVERPIAHRGYHDRAAGRVENTVSAVLAAIAHKFAVEIDLQLSADEQVVVFHDATLDRLTTISGRVDRSSLAGLRATRLRDSDDRIPTLDEILEEVAGRIPLFLELKSDWTGDRRLARAVARSIAGYVGAVAVMSFDPHILSAFRQLAPHIPRGLVASPIFPAEAHASPLNHRLAQRHLIGAGFALPSFIAYDVKALPATAPLLIRHIFGVPLLAWTVRTTSEFAIGRHWADQIIFEGFDPAATRGSS
jgi:glycerophosphoryl diester phosphodiesterase